MSRGPAPQGGVGTAPPVSPEKPRPAKWLTVTARAIFDELVERLDSAGGASKTHEEAANLCAMALDEVRSLSAILERHGTTYETVDKMGNTVYKARPEYAQRSEASRRATALLIELGLTPAARKRVPNGPKSGPKPGGDFDNL